MVVGRDHCVAESISSFQVVKDGQVDMAARTEDIEPFVPACFLFICGVCLINSWGVTLIDHYNSGLN